MLRPFLCGLSVPAAGLALLFFASLVVEDQRAYVSCRITTTHSQKSRAMIDHPYSFGSFEESVCLAADDGILTERQLIRLLAAHSVTLAEYLADLAGDGPDTCHAAPYAAVAVLSWLGY